MIRVMLVGLIVVVGLTGCNRFGLGDRSKGAESERELPFRTKLSKGDDKRDISISVDNKGEGLEAVRESVRFEATKYCLLNYGGSDAEWAIDSETDDWAFSQDGSALVFEARCVAI